MSNQDRVHQNTTSFEITRLLEKQCNNPELKHPFPFMSLYSDSLDDFWRTRGLDIEAYMPFSIASVAQATKDINKAECNIFANYLKYQQPLKIRIEFSKHETEVASTEKRVHRAKGFVCIHKMANSLMHNTSNFVDTQHKYMAIAGRAYEEAKAVVA